MRVSHSVRYLPRSQWADALHARALAEPGAHKLPELLGAFRAHSAFYAGRLKGLSSFGAAAPLMKSELSCVPVVSSEPMYEVRTSGTSGVQVSVQNTLMERRFRQALAYRPFLFYPLAADESTCVRQVIFVDGRDVDAYAKQQWPYPFGRRTFLTWRVGIAAPVDEMLDLLRAVRPQVVRGLTSGIVRLAEDAGTLVDNCGIRVVSPSGEYLSPEWRELLQAAFAAPVLDRYGATETGSIAWQCPYCGNYHANSDEIILEQGLNGLLATPLFVESQPLLRYQLGDRVTLGAGHHDCHIRLPLLTIRAARRDDWVIDGFGAKVSPLSFQFERVNGLQAWRIYQNTEGDLTLYFDAAPDVTDVDKQLEAQLRSMVPKRNFHLVAGTAQLKQEGKFKRVVSDFRPERASSVD